MRGTAGICNSIFVLPWLLTSACMDDVYDLLIWNTPILSWEQKWNFRDALLEEKSRDDAAVTTEWEKVHLFWSHYGSLSHHSHPPVGVYDFMNIVQHSADHWIFIFHTWSTIGQQEQVMRPLGNYWGSTWNKLDNNCELNGHHLCTA